MSWTSPPIIMKLVRPLSVNFLTQKFGANKLPIYKELGMLGHNGQDWAGRHGIPIRWDCTDCEGEVIYTHIDKYGGLGVGVVTDDADGRFVHLFWHLSEFKCKVGDRLGSGDIIGLCGTTGLSTGNHLHRGLKRITNKNITRNHDNGYFGAIDIAPFFAANIYIKNYMDNLHGQLNILTKVVNLIKEFLKQ